MLQHIPLAGRNRFLADITNAELNQAAGVKAGTHSKCKLAWHQWLLYLHELNIPSHDPFLTDFSEHHRIVFLCAFIQYVRDGNCLHGGESVRAATSREAIDYMAQKFRANRRPDPQLDASNTISLLLTRQTKGYKNADPAAMHEKALSVSFYRFLHSAAVTEFDCAIAFLCTLAFFFAM